MRQLLALAAGAGVAALGGLILGEYPFTGVTPYVAGLLFGLVVAEVVVTISQRHSLLVGIASSVCTVAGLGWAVWISSGRGIAPIPGGAWVGIAIGGVVALLRGAVRRAGRPTERNQTSP
jgi:hypothetical protein